MKPEPTKERYVPTAPSIRRHFLGTEFPRDWSTPHLDSLIDENAPVSYGILMPGDHVPDGVPVIKVKDYVNGRLSLDKVTRTSREIDAQYKRSRVKTGDVLISIRGGTGELAFVPAEFDGANITQDTARLRANKKVDARFLLHALKSDFVSTQIQLETIGQAVTGINIGSVRRLVIPVPPLVEQSKIADILGTWDNALEKLDALIAAKEHRKLALMQHLLHAAADKAGHGHTRHRLSEIVERVTRKNSVGNDNVLTISAQDGLINQREYFNRSVAGANLAAYILLRRGEFAYNRSSSIGYPYGAIKRMDRYDQGIVSTLYLCFRLRDNAQVSSDYLAQYLDGGYLNSGLRAIAKEGARAHGLLNVTADEFMDLDIFLPPLPLQEKIATVLEAADTELVNLRGQRASLDEQKCGLMQKLLTGQKRVTTQTP